MLFRIKQYKKIQMYNQQGKKERSVDEEFILKKNIGSGTFGTVEKRQRKKDNKTFAIKVIGNVNLMMSDAIESEAKVMQMTKSDYTINLIDYFYDEDYEGGSYIFVMPYCRDGSLSKLMQRKWEEEQILLFLYQICEAFLAIPEDKGYWHLDLKPDNILLKSDGEYLVCDFGCAKMVDNPTVSQNLRMSMGKGGGTTDYASPQMIVNYESNKYSDIWALGIITYEILYKSHPLKKENRNYSDEVHKFWDNMVKIKFPPVEGYENVIQILRKILKPKHRMQWPQLKQAIYYALGIPPKVPIVVSIDKLIDYINDLSIIIYGLVHYLIHNNKNIEKLQLKKVTDNLIQYSKTYIFTLVNKAIESIENHHLKPNQLTFFLFKQTKRNYTIVQKQKLEHAYKAISNFSQEMMEQSHFDDFTSARLSLEDALDDFQEELREKSQEQLKFHPLCEWHKIEKIITFLKGKTDKVRNTEYQHRDKIHNFAKEILHF